MLPLMDVTTSLYERIAASGPLVAFQLLILFLMYKFFQKEIDKKDRIIEAKDVELRTRLEAKDLEIKNLNTKLVDITERCLDATLKNNTIIERLGEWIKETINRK